MITNNEKQESIDFIISNINIKTRKPSLYKIKDLITTIDVRYILKDIRLNLILSLTLWALIYNASTLTFNNPLNVMLLSFIPYSISYIYLIFSIDKRIKDLFTSTYFNINQIIAYKVVIIALYNSILNIMFLPLINEALMNLNPDLVFIEIIRFYILSFISSYSLSLLFLYISLKFSNKYLSSVLFMVISIIGLLIFRQLSKDTINIIVNYIISVNIFVFVLTILSIIAIFANFIKSLINRSYIMGRS